ncbi:MAG TPA: alpha/beta hydrolase-fold protein [Leifsonia sp.]|jgi:phospholipase/carboxylesterase|nr:alpha/beta hydrolase-fold protein [Leifsonia sp.]
MSPISLPIDDAAVVWSVPPDELGSRPLVVLMHGRGSHERDLVALVPSLPAEPVYASLRAPIIDGDGWSWFLSGQPGAPDPASAVAAARGVLDWLDRVAPSGPVSAVGFSQGGAMATQLLRHAPERFASFVNLAGFIVEAAGAGIDERLATGRKPVFWGRDPRDPIIPASAVERTLAWLPSHSELTVREYHGIGHSVSRQEVDDVGEFLAATLLA